MAEREARNGETPAADRPLLPGYGVNEDPHGMLPWSFVDERLADARNYWVCTTRPDGRPHATPVWGAWVDKTFYFGAQGTSRKARNLAANPSIAIHLESGDEVVVLEGVAERLTAMTEDVYARVAAAYAAKYDGFRPDPPSQETSFYAVRPYLVMAWLEREFLTTPSRWRLGPTRADGLARGDATRQLHPYHCGNIRRCRCGLVGADSRLCWTNVASVGLCVCFPPIPSRITSSPPPAARWTGRAQVGSAPS